MRKIAIVLTLLFLLASGFAALSYPYNLVAQGLIALAAIVIMISIARLVMAVVKRLGQAGHSTIQFFERCFK